MKRTLILIVLLSGLVGCGGGQTPRPTAADEQKIQEKMRHEFGRERSNK